eukprot:SAG22_NODE_302_length_12743_cov_12.397738_12_plen_103_part_00
MAQPSTFLSAGHFCPDSAAHLFDYNANNNVSCLSAAAALTKPTAQVIAGMARLGMSGGSEEVRKLMTMADLDGDGKIEPNEFVQVRCSCSCRPSHCGGYPYE